MTTEAQDRLGQTRECQEAHELKTLQTRSSGQSTANTNPHPSTSTTNITQRTKHPSTFSILTPSLYVYVPLSAARDHLANERVFLAYIRTSAALANFAVVIVQLYRLKHEPPPKGTLSDYDLGIPLAAVTLALAMVVSVVGAIRFFICQHAMARKKIRGSGNVVVIFTVGTGLVSLPDHRLESMSPLIKETVTSSVVDFHSYR